MTSSLRFLGLSSANLMLGEPQTFTRNLRWDDIVVERSQDQTQCMSHANRLDKKKETTDAWLIVSGLRSRALEAGGFIVFSIINDLPLRRRQR